MKFFMFFVFIYFCEALFSQEINFFCQKCGAKQIINNIYCGTCGAKLDKTIYLKKIENKIDSLYNINQFPISSKELNMYIEYKNKNKEISETPIVTNAIDNFLKYLVLPIFVISWFIIIFY